MTAYYNEMDPKAAAWLRELIKDGHIAPGEVDERSIEDVRPGELAGYTQCHFFAGIGGWSYALRLAGVADSERVWTGSCPCQPFSAAGKGAGFADERHLWPAWFHLVRECRPSQIFGEQVANALPWFDLVSTDLEAEGYAVGACIVGAHSVGAPHIRQRLYFVGHASGQRQPQRGVQLRQSESSENGVCGVPKASGRSATYRTIERSDLEQANPEFGNMEHAEGGGLAQPDSGIERRGPIESRAGIAEVLARQTESGRCGLLGNLEHAAGERLEGRSVPTGERGNERAPWAASDLVWCRDGKWRPVEPGTFPLAHGVPGRVGLLRGYGNAIVPQVAAAFIEAYRGLA